MDRFKKVLESILQVKYNYSGQNGDRFVVVNKWRQPTP
jgi:hypothetical protein